MIRRLMNSASGALATISLLAAAPALADDVKLPPTMTVTAYEPPHQWVVDKDGDLLRGVGIMRVTPTPDGCRVTWINELTLPFGLLGRAGFLVTRPVAELALGACLRRLARLLRSGALPLDDHLPRNEREVLR